MKTLQESWREYRNAIYPPDISATQNRECHQAFISGAFVTLGLTSQLSELPEPEAVIELQKLWVEAEQILGDRIKQMATERAQRQ